MPAPTSINEFLELTQKSGVVDNERLSSYVGRLRTAGQLPVEPKRLAGMMLRDGLLTKFQAEQLLAGRWRRFTIGKYRVLERIGSGGMGAVYLCQHKLMNRRVAIKVLPPSKTENSSSLERFQREARVIGALDHVNIVRAYDIDRDDNLHFFVMEYVDGASLQELVDKFGPLDPLRACHYVCQAALGLQHALDQAAIIHRDIKPGNILVDRQGVVKILDMGLARFSNDDEDVLTKQYDEQVLGTADYLAPEQAIDSHAVDIRADIYSLGATFYFMLTGAPPFGEGTVAQKLLWHQTRDPKPVRTLRPKVPVEVEAIVQKMMAKDVNARYQSPIEVAEALASMVATPIAPPPESEMPRLSPAALASGGPSASGPASPAPAARGVAPKTPAPRPLPATAAPAVEPKPPVAPVSPAAQPQGPETAPVWAAIAADTPKPIQPSHERKKSRTAKEQDAAAVVTTPRRRATSRRKWFILLGIGGVILAVLVAIGVLAALGVFGSA